MLSKLINLVVKLSSTLYTSDGFMIAAPGNIFLTNIHRVYDKKIDLPSEEDANNWWNDVDYQELSNHRRAGTDATIQRIKGLPPRE